MSTKSETKAILIILSMFIGGIVSLCLPSLTFKALGFILIPLAALTTLVALGIDTYLSRKRQVETS